MATVEEKILEIKMRIEGADSVKELKEVIADLTPEMGSLDTASEEYKQTVDLMVKAQEKLTTAMKVGKSQIDAQEGSYNALVNRMAALKKVQKAVTDDETRQKLSIEINDINDQLKAYDQANGVYVRNVGNYKSALEGFDGVVVSFQDRMKEAMDTLEPTKQKFESVQKIATGVASGFAALQGVTALLGIENENLEKSLVKVQAAMAIAQGIGGLKDLYEGVARWGVAFGETAKAAENTKEAVKGFNDVAESADNVAKAAAAASSADAAAKGAQTVATEGATVAQKGLNTAMKANPIGLIIVAITTLIGLFAWLKDDIVEILGGTEKLNDVWNSFSVVFTGVGNVVKQIVLGPIKLLISEVKTLVNVISNIAEGDFKGAWNAIKNGFEDVANVAKDTFNVIGNYQEAAAEKSTEIADKQRAKEAEKRAKELEAYIKDMEAKNGSDWKYSNEGRKAYEELLKKKLDMYKKDSDEYKQALRDMWIYNRDYQNRVTKIEDDENKKRLEAKKKALEEEKRLKEKILQEYQNYVDNYLKTDREKLLEEQEKRRTALKTAYDKGLIDYETYVEKGKELLDKLSVEEQDFDFEKQIKDFETKIKAIQEFGKKREGLFNLWVKNDGDDGVERYFTQLALDATKYSEEFINGVNKEIEDALVGIDYTRAIEAQTTQIVVSYNSQIEALNEAIKVAGYRFEQFKNEYGEDNDLTKKAAKELNSYWGERYKLESEKFKEISDLRVAFLKKEVEDEQRALDEKIFKREQEYLEYQTKYSGLWGLANNYISQMYKLKAAEDDIHNSRIAALTEMKEKYESASKDMQLTAEERVKAEAEAAKISAEIMREEADYTLLCNQRKGESVDAYVGAVQDSLSGISSILSTVAGAWETSIQAQIDSGEISEEEGEKEFEKMKGIQSAIALINTFTSAVSAYQSMASIPYVGPILGAAAAAAAIASGIAQVKAINATKIGDKGGSSSSTKYAEVTPSVTSDYTPTMVQNATGAKETEDLANALSKQTLKAYVVESEISDAQNRANQRNKESSF